MKKYNPLSYNFWILARGCTYKEAEFEVRTSPDYVVVLQ